MNFSDLQAVNEDVNRLPYVSDAKRYGADDFWADIDQNGGDCDDYAIGKLRRLVQRGWPIKRLSLACCFVETGEYHAVLVVSAEDGDYMLDNRQAHTVPVAELAAWAYTPHVIQKEGGSRDWVEWKGSSGAGSSSTSKSGEDHETNGT